MKHQTAEIWDGQDSKYQLRITEIIGDKEEVALVSTENSLQEAYDHVDRLRQQTGAEIWLRGVEKAFLADGTPIVIRPYFCDEETRRNSEQKIRGLGQFAYTKGNYQGKEYWNWYYKAPSRPWTQIGGQYCNSSTPPPLPRPRSEWRQCGCREHQHTCGACGKPYWVELHGVADGYCTYCYYAG